MVRADAIYMGIVEDVLDPKREGRIKVRVYGVYDKVSKGDIPWSSPWRDLAGKKFSIPSIGKLVNVIFPLADFEAPVYIYSERYNINLQNKLKKLSDDEYKNFVSLLLDNRTQIFADDIKLVLDYYITNININTIIKCNTNNSF